MRVKWCKEHLHWRKADWYEEICPDESPYVLRFNGRKRVVEETNERYAVHAFKGNFKHDLKIMV